MPVAGRVDEAPAPDAFGLERERGVGGDRLEAHRAACRVGGVEVVPDRDPVEAVSFDAPPEPAQLIGRRVLEPGVDAELHAAPAVAPTSGPPPAATSSGCSGADTSRP